MKNRIENIKKQIVDVEMDYDSFKNVVQSEFYELGVEVSLSKVNDFPDNTVSVCGYYNSFEWQEHENIEMVLVVSSDTNYIDINTDDWNFLEHQMQQTIEHEIIHRNQVIARNGFEPIHIIPDNMSPAQERIIYLSNPDEIDAYANDVTLDLLKSYTYQGATRALVEYSIITIDVSPILYEYVELFGVDSDIVKTIVKKSLKILQT